MNERLGHIYLITNDLNNKVYVGQTARDIDERFFEHCVEKRGNSKLHNAIQKYGREHFRVSLIEDISLSQLDEAEKKWIKYYDSVSNGYNICLGGAGVPLPTARVGITENNLIFPSKEDMARMISRITSWSLSFLRNQLASVINNKEKDFLGYHIVYLSEEEIPSDDDVLEDWIKTLSIRYNGKHIYCEELDMQFETIAEAAQYLIENNLYTTTSRTPIQSLVTSIGRVINGKSQYIKGVNSNLKFIQVPGTKKNPGYAEGFKGSKIYCPQLDKVFDSQIEASHYMIDNKIWTGIKLKTAKLRISDIVRGAFPDYKGYTFQKVG